MDKVTIGITALVMALLFGCVLSAKSEYSSVPDIADTRVMQHPQTRHVVVCGGKHALRLINDPDITDVKDYGVSLENQRRISATCVREMIRQGYEEILY